MMTTQTTPTTQKHLIKLPNEKKVTVGKYVEAFKTLKSTNPDTLIKGFWHESEKASLVLKEMRKAIHTRINASNAITRKMKYDYQISLYRDSQKVIGFKTRRIRFYQFETKEFKTRLGHLISDRDDF
jgi:hypothetical protein